VYLIFRALFFLRCTYPVSPFPPALAASFSRYLLAFPRCPSFLVFTSSFSRPFPQHAPQLHRGLYVADADVGGSDDEDEAGDAPTNTDNIEKIVGTAEAIAHEGGASTSLYVACAIALLRINGGCAWLDAMDEAAAEAVIAAGLRGRQGERKRQREEAACMEKEENRRIDAKEAKRAATRAKNIAATMKYAVITPFVKPAELKKLVTADPTLGGKKEIATELGVKPLNARFELVFPEKKLPIPALSRKDPATNKSADLTGEELVALYTKEHPKRVKKIGGAVSDEDVALHFKQRAEGALEGLRDGDATTEAEEAQEAARAATRASVAAARIVAQTAFAAAKEARAASAAKRAAKAAKGAGASRGRGRGRGRRGRGRASSGGAKAKAKASAKKAKAKAPAKKAKAKAASASTEPEYQVLWPPLVMRRVSAEFNPHPGSRFALGTPLYKVGWEHDRTLTTWEPAQHLLVDPRVTQDWLDTKVKEYVEGASDDDSNHSSTDDGDDSSTDDGDDSGSSGWK
jgi:hypothetical protein